MAESDKKLIQAVNTTDQAGPQKPAMSNVYQFILYDLETGMIQRILSYPTYPEGQFDERILKSKGMGILRLVGNLNIDVNKHYVDVKKKELKTFQIKAVIQRLDIPREAAELLSDDPFQIQVLILSDPDIPSGFGLQSKFLKEGLERRGYSIRQISWKDKNRVLEENFDILVTLGDIAYIRDFTTLNFPTWVHWLPIDTDHWQPKEVYEDIKKIPYVVSMSNYGSRVLASHGVVENVVTIPHGIDMNVFRAYPLKMRQKIRKLNGYHGKFIVTCIATNVHRKRIDLLIKAFSKFVTTLMIDDAQLIIKSVPKLFFDIPELILKAKNKFNYDAENMIKIMDEKLEDEEIVHLINASDLIANATSAEGFGITTIEALACGIPVLIGDHTTTPELVNNVCPTIKIKENYTENLNGIDLERYQIDDEDMTQKMILRYSDWKKGNTSKRLDLRRQVEATYDINGIIRQWDNFLSNIVEHDEEIDVDYSEDSQEEAQSNKPIGSVGTESKWTET